MKTVPLVSLVLSIFLLAATTFAGDESGGEVLGEKAFMEAKCNICHGVQAAEIAPKAKSEKMWGPDLGGYKAEVDFATVAAYARKAGELNGKLHKKEFKGTDEELQAILDWLARLETSREPSS